MKPKSIITLLLGIAASLCLATQCPKEENPNELPPETQEGKNTFGCYVNGELFVKSPKASMPNSLIARYDRKEKNLFVRCVSPNHCLIGLEIDNPQEKELNSLVSGYFILSSQNSQYWLCENCSQIFITNFDTINCIVSGTFEFLGKCAYISQGHVDTLTNVYCSEESTVRVTDGRFDIKLDIY